MRGASPPSQINMSMITECMKCGENFRKFSMKALDRVCMDCKSARKNHIQTKKVTEIPTNIIEARLTAVENSLKVLHTMIGVEINTSVRLEVEPLIGQLFDEKFSELKGLVASTLTKAKKSQEEVEAINAEIKGRKHSLTKAWKAINALREEIEDLHNQQ